MDKQLQNNDFMSFEPADKPIPEVHKYLLGGVAPRPIAFVSTQSKDGVDNLAPFSFFNVFGANPPYLAFSPARRGRDNTTKDTYHNLLDTGECVVHTVTSDIVHQMNLASCEYDTAVDEFQKAGFTKIKSDIVKPPRVAESPFQLECLLDQMVELGGGAGSGNLAICKVVKFHVAERIIADNTISPQLLDAVARNGGNYYTHANGDALFQIDKPNRDTGIGFDKLPDVIKTSPFLTGNDLAQLAMVTSLPSKTDAESRLKKYSTNKHEYIEELPDYLNGAAQYLTNKELFFEMIKTAIRKKDISLAWDLIMIQID